MLKACDFGVPQRRERLYIIDFLNPSVEFKFPTPLGIKPRLGDILEEHIDDKSTISNKLWEGHQKRKENNKIAGKGFGYGLFFENSATTNTLSARYYKDGSEI
ncbi:hypothetical protein B2I23_03450 [Candidatus Liberibacter asiaticus]|uniref:DNA-methyltransferase MKpn2kI n=1 Tax=Candidatus Liberibacter asiaticus str. gxpsy TaxID=1174529 RepID=A0ABM5NG94_LIBAS|nr:DNA-methyltransferase MKpn2kI [Candidatus Liberibacter asiaticus str. gxpsy]ASK52862.1 hypothetical protein B2I23_03450 [Candidatus Liberibacter asiaticus]BAP26564.1 DNA-methyltransferase MKpn2kI [Candidatus Liberibacter asiaticus str. Ishi-1]KAE9509992.1 DNA-cytosine methyltransferase [Candidatus Liberibacter asiaticus]KAE9510773.1 DNA-cytosine methyltransferase [Candidatus Liberibacter asiaticus]